MIFVYINDIENKRKPLFTKKKGKKNSPDIYQIYSHKSGNRELILDVNKTNLLVFFYLITKVILDLTRKLCPKND